jgi:hypothetical protein
LVKTFPIGATRFKDSFSFAVPFTLFEGGCDELDGLVVAVGLSDGVGCGLDSGVGELEGAGSVGD